MGLEYCVACFDQNILQTIGHGSSIYFDKENSILVEFCHSYVNFRTTCFRHYPGLLGSALEFCDLESDT